jgi:RNA polymerase sigma-54 factor
MELVRTLDPQGTCVSDYKESLLVQTRLRKDAPEGVEEALAHLELLDKGKTAEAAKRMKRSEEEVRGILEFVKEFRPSPAVSAAGEGAT